MTTAPDLPNPTELAIPAFVLLILIEIWWVRRRDARAYEPRDTLTSLALGLGSREIASQILAGIYVRELYQVGQQVQIGAVEGQIEEIGTVKTTLLTEAGELVSVANRTLLEQQVSSR